MSKEKKDLKKTKKDESKQSDVSESQEIIEKLKQEITDLDGKHKRALADYQNLLKNNINEKADFLKYSLEGFFLEILPIYDNLKMSIKTLNSEEEKSPWVEGVKYVIKQFQDVFTANGLTEIKTTGEKFDYNTMEAVEGDGDDVISELRAGYELKGKVIIPAKVVLSAKDNKKEE
jgi:molecular chaperone GrpE